MTENAHLSSTPSLVLAETRHAVLSHPSHATAAMGVPVVLVNPLTAPSEARSFADETRLNSVLDAAGHPAATVSWRHLWNADGKERFAPRVNDLEALIQSLGTHAQTLHLAAIGNGAIVALKWLAQLQDYVAASDEKAPYHVISLTLISPELNIFSRIPRTSLRGALQTTCVVANGASETVRDARHLANKLPQAPLFALAHDHSRFELSEENPASEAGFMEMSASFEGDWRLSWADWLHRVHIANKA